MALMHHLQITLEVELKFEEMLEGADHLPGGDCYLGGWVGGYGQGGGDVYGRRVP